MNNYNSLSGVLNCQNASVSDFMAQVKKMEQELGINPNDYLGEFCPIFEYINCPLDLAFEYATKTENLAEWTVSLRNFEKYNDILYKADDILEPNTKIYIKTESNKETGCVDYLCAWDQYNELWMRYYFRFLDAELVLGKMGTVLVWFNCKHKYYDKRNQEIPHEIFKLANRTDRNWVGDLWDIFYFGHKIEIINLKLILEEQYKVALNLQ